MDERIRCTCRRLHLHVCVIACADDALQPVTSGARVQIATHRVIYMCVDVHVSARDAVRCCVTDAYTCVS
jgi:hypothetical protein